MTIVATVITTIGFFVRLLGFPYSGLTARELTEIAAIALIGHVAAALLVDFMVAVGLRVHIYVIFWHKMDLVIRLEILQRLLRK